MANSGFMGFLNDPNVRNWIGGISKGLGAKVNDPDAPMADITFGEINRLQNQDKRKEMLSQLQDPSFLNDPAKRQQIGAMLLSSDDPKLQTFGEKLLMPPTGSNAGFSLSPGSIRYDAQGRVIADRSKDVSEATKTSQERGKQTMWTSLPADWRSNTLAIGNALGYSARETEDAFLNGKTVQDMAREKGLPEDMVPDPAYPPTHAQINAMQQRRAAQAEIKVLDEFITPAQSRYAQRVNGVPVQLVKDMFSKDDDVKDKVSDYVASKMLQVEGFATRIKSMGGNVSEAAIDKLMKESLADFKIPGVAITPDIWEKASRKVTKTILDAGEAANKITARSGMSKENENKQSPVEINWKVVNGKLVKG